MLKTFFIGLIILTQTAAQSSVLHWLTQPTEPMPLIANNDASSGYYNDYKISTNGRYITFISQATNLVESDHNGAEDLFMHDAVTGITKRVNTTNNGSELETGIRHFSAATADGQFVAFASSDQTLAGADTEGQSWVFLKNLNTETVQNISGYGTGAYFSVNWHMHLSDNAEYLTFISPTQIDPLHTTTSSQLYRKNLNNNGIQLLSTNNTASGAANDTIIPIDVSSNGRYILVTTEATDLTSDIINNALQNLFLYDNAMQTFTLINITPDGQSSVDGDFIEFGGVSNNGDVAFVTDQFDLVNDDTNSQEDVFFYSNGSIQRINLTPDGQQLDDGHSYYTDINDAGSHIVFSESSAAITNNDNNGLNDVFLYDINSSTTTLVSKNSQNTAANDYSTKPKISGNGSRVVFVSRASDLNDEPVNYAVDELFVHDIQSAITKKITQPAFSPTTISSDIRNPRISQDQMTLVYSTQSAGFDGVSSGEYDLYLLDRTTDQHQLLFSKADSPDISPSGQYVVFTSAFSQPDGLTDLGDPNVYLFDLSNDNLVLIDEGYTAYVNDEGRVVFWTDKSISAQDLEERSFDVYGFDPSDSSIHLISAGMDGLAVGGHGIDIGGTGANTVTVFASYSEELVPNDTFTQDVFVRQWPVGQITKISQTATGETGDGISSYPRLSDNGRFVAYTTEAKNLTSDDYTDATFNQIIYHDRQQQTNYLASINDLGLPVEGGLSITFPGISPSGRYVTYTYFDRDDTTGFDNDDDQKADVVLFDTLNQTSRIISESNQYPTLANRSVAGSVLQILESNDNPALIGILFTASKPTDLTGIANHPGHSEAFLYQQGGPDLTLTVTIQGAGSITGTAGINCSSSCQYDFALGSEISVIATPDIGAQFIGWQTTFTSCDDNNTLCNTLIDRNQIITAQFTDPFDLIFSDGFDTTP